MKVVSEVHGVRNIEHLPKYFENNVPNNSCKKMQSFQFIYLKHKKTKLQFFDYTLKNNINK